MIPIGDRLSTRTIPYVNIAIIAVNFLVFFYELTLNSQASFRSASELDLWFQDWGAVPACIADSLGLKPNVDPRALAVLCDSDRSLLTLFTSMFMHAGWLHILGNMLFLWVFGDNVEDALGHVRYLAFYLIAGLAASATQVALNMSDFIPSVGASGAIAGVMGAYLVMFPQARIAVVIPLFWFLGATYMPAIALIGIWFLMQLFTGVASIGYATGGGGGVAWWAHIGGFLAGLLLVNLFRAGRPPPRRVRYWRGRSWEE
jgi:membrane associated rhomboid family serine protease